MTGLTDPDRPNIEMILCYLFMIALFLLPSRFSYLFPLGNIETTLLIFNIILLLFLLIIFFLQNRGKFFYRKTYLSWFVFVMYLFFVTGLYSIGSKSYFNITPFIILFFPMLVSFGLLQLNNLDIIKILKFFSFICLILSIQVVLISVIGLYLSGLFNLYRMTIIGIGRGDTYILRAFSTFGPSGPTSIAIAHGMVLNIYFYTLSGYKISKILYLINTVLNIIAIFLCFTRSTFLAIILAFIISLILSPLKISKFNIRILFLVVIILFGGILLLLISKVPLYRFFTLEMKEVGSSDWIRLMAVNLTLKMFEEKPLFGSGVGFFYPRDASTEYINLQGYLIPRDPHNFYVLLLYEGGVLGISLLIIVFIFLIKDIVNSMKFSFTREERYLKNALFINILIVLIYNLFSSYLAVGFRMALLFWFLISLSLAKTNRTKIG